MTLFNCKPAHRIVSGFHPDPSICRTPEGRYLMVNSSFEFFPGLPVFESEDGEHWTKIGDALARSSQFVYERIGNSQGMYAPTIRVHDGVYYLIVTNVNAGNLMLTSSDPHAGWSDPVWIDGWPGIDPSLFVDDDGTAYICGNEGAQTQKDGEAEPAGIYMSRIDLSTGRVLDARRRICAGITGSNPEGPHIYKRAGMYYLMWAEGGTESGHMENMARARDPEGPYEMYPGNPLITNRSTHLTLQAIGHCDCADFEDDRSLMVFHGTRNNNEYPAQGWIGREPYAVRFTWKGGWPDLSDQSYETQLEGKGDALERAVAWITPGIDVAGRHRVHHHADSTSVVIAAGRATFDPAYGAPLIGTRQTDMMCDFSAVLLDPSRILAGEAGIVVYANAGHYMTLSVQAPRDGMSLIECRVHNAGLDSIVASARLSDRYPVRIGVRGDDTGYSFRASSEPGSGINLGHAPGKVLSFTNAGGFTGTLLGFYAHGEGLTVFDDVEYTLAEGVTGAATSHEEGRHDEGDV
ncbi:MAG: family 43 glycosylhydrolase [Bifidobacterium psychraerophilum]|uniref:glycoside hydrolase family 43 protein n=1 Tax=Bifidobacterium psychraerophilum TaxID=218140 RepID=UPI0039ECDB84